MDEKLRYKDTDFYFPSEALKRRWDEARFDPQLYWGEFSREPLPEGYRLPAWALGGFKKHGRPVLAPSEGGWDCGVFGGGVHNGAVIVKDGLFYYIYRGEFPCEPDNPFGIAYKCNIGIAVSSDGVRFEKRNDLSPVFRGAEDAAYSFEDVCVVEHGGRYYMYVNRWNWKDPQNTRDCGVYLAVSDDLLHWERVGIVFAGEQPMHRNACVLQDPHNRAVRVGGRFVMYMSTMRYCLVCTSKDLLHWETKQLERGWPGGECCFALADYAAGEPENILLFTGGRHTGHHYAVGEVLLQKKDPFRPVAHLPRPVLYSEPQYPWENGLSAENGLPVSYFRDTVFFNGLTLHGGVWYLYYGGSEYYTCLATKKQEGAE